MLDLTGKKVVVTGGRGFLGRAVCKILEERGADAKRWGKIHGDLRRTEGEEWPGALWLMKPDVIIHLAATCGGIGANMAAPADFIMDNLQMGLNVIEEARNVGAKLVMVGSVCAYPEHNNGLIRESDLWNGYPEPTNAPYGLAKRVLGEVLSAYHRQHGLPCAYVIPANLYGPGDNFDLNTSHVIPAIIRKMAEAPHGPVKLWGTGLATRDFLYVEDAAEAIVRAAEMIDTPEPINVGTGAETSILEVSRIIADAMHYTGGIAWDDSKPNGQPRRVLDTQRQRARLAFFPATDLHRGIAKTVKWYSAQFAKVS